MTLDHLSGGRLRLGLGVSGPQVAEGWYGEAFDHPLERTREYVSLVRAALAREAPLASEGPHYPLPLPGSDGKALKMNVRPLRPGVPIYLAAMGPRNVALAAEIADGWLPLFLMPERMDAFELTELRDGFDVAPMVHVAIDDDLAAARDAVRGKIALYVGAYGPRGANFYHRLVTRFGFGESADQIQAAALEGRMSDATAAVPDELVDAVALVGPVERIRDRVDAYREAGVTTLLAMTKEMATIRALAQVVA
jgi:F420-dependent oxidoreductase-like protein